MKESEIMISTIPRVSSRGSSTGSNPSTQVQTAQPSVQAVQHGQSFHPAGLTGCLGGAAIFVMSMAFPVIILGLGFALSLNFDGDFASQLTVLTGVRTRDWSAPNAYSMGSFQEDEHTRLYVCLKQHDLAAPAVSSVLSLAQYRDSLKGYFNDTAKRNCELESDFSWPRDYGFLTCVQSVLNLSAHSSNLFLSCLDSAEGVMLYSIQTPASMTFLGSFNQGALLLASGAVIASFMVFTNCGLFATEDVRVNGLTLQGYDPLSFYSNVAACVVTFVWLVFAFWYAFPGPNVWSDIPAQSGKKSFPNTPWTGYVVCFVFLSLLWYFVSFLLESLFQDNHAPEVDSVQSQGTVVDHPSSQGTDSSQTWSQGSNSNSVVLNPSLVTIRNDSLRPSPSLVSVVQPSGRGTPDPTPAQAGPPDYGPFKGFASRMPARTGMVFHRHRSDPGWTYHNYRPLATKLPDYLANDTLYLTEHGTNDYHLVTRVFPTIYASAWVFTDGLLFLGLLNTQNSPLNETVIEIFCFITMCRILQLSSSYFLNDHLSDEYFQREPRDARRDDFIPNFIATHLASLACFIVACYHFLIASPYVKTITDLGLGTASQGIQDSLVVILAIVELLKFVVVALVGTGDVNGSVYILIMRVVSLFEGGFRFILILAALFAYPSDLRGQNGVLNSFLAGFS